MPRALFWAVLCSGYFMMVYGWCNNFTHQRFLAGEKIPSFYFEWEKKIPLIPIFIIPYMSIDLFFFASAFLCTDLGELRTHGKRLLLAITFAAVCFIVFPLRYGFSRPEVPGMFGPIFHFLHGFDKPYNLAPSLHIALRSLLWIVYVRHTRGVLRWSSRVWFLLIGLSTLFVFQHHVIDLVTGQLLAMLCFYAIPDATDPEEAQLFQQKPTNRRVAATYLSVLLGILVGGVFMRRWGWIMIWPGFAMAMVSLAYLGWGVQVFHKRHGRVPITTRVLLGPYYIGAALLWLWFRSREPWQEVAPNVLIGRWVDRAETQRLLEQGVSAVLDLSAEYPTPRGLLHLPYLNIQILDMTPPTVEQLQSATAFITRHVTSGKVFVYCAMGYTRSATVAAAYLLSSDAALTVDEALASIRRVRPGIVIRRANLNALENFADALGEELARSSEEGAELVKA
ncbi:MAG TPA: phosphatase PAP2/dual specificity phosphatase family protein [Tepidisphaeraceae bacterium]|nr:phosphatase PAP2/dual specificity phosphatase family protein [Tepidisphaeraceae bacterium]